LQVDRWFDRARTYEELARESVGKERYAFACFASQQAVEFYVKGLLIKLVGAKAYSHSLKELMEALKATGITVPSEV